MQRLMRDVYNGENELDGVSGQSLCIQLKLLKVCTPKTVLKNLY